MDVFKNLVSLLTNFIWRYPLVTFLFIILGTYVPCFVSLILGGDFFVTSLDFGTVEFRYGTIPIGLTIYFILSLPLVYYVKRDIAKRDRRNQEALAKAFGKFEATQAKRDQRLENFWNRKR